VVADQDRMIDPRAEESMARKIGATTIRVDSSHVAMLSHPKAVADAIIAAARKVQ
jgi:pimeloyl-ACP methyl ester carboxylesterase